MAQYNLTGLTLDPKSFQHPLDRQATQAIQASESFQKIIEWISKNSVEREAGLLYRSSFAQVTPSVSPKISAMVDEGCRMFGTDKRPDVYLQRAYPLDIALQGVDQPRMVLSTELIKNTSERGLWGLIAGQMAAIRSGCCQIRFVETLCSLPGLVPEALTLPLTALFVTWRKFAQLSLDRASLIATGDMNETVRAMLAGQAPIEVLQRMDFADPSCGYMAQAQEFLKGSGGISSALRAAKAALDDKLFLAGRYVELFKFYQSAYHDILDD